MNIAIPVYGNRVMPRFGMTREMMIVTVENGKVVAEKRVTMTPDVLFASLADVFQAEQVAVVICGGIHPRFQEAFKRHRLQLIWGVIGEWPQVVQAFLNETLQSDPAFCLRRHGAGRGSRFRQGQQRRRR